MADPSIGKFFAKAAESELGKTSPPNKIRALDIFRPSEMKAALKPYHSHIETFRSWLIKQECGETAESLRELISACYMASESGERRLWEIPGS